MPDHVLCYRNIDIIFAIMDLKLQTDEIRQYRCGALLSSYGSLLLSKFHRHYRKTVYGVREGYSMDDKREGVPTGQCLVLWEH